MRNIVSAVFDSRAQAEQALMQLRAAGIPDNRISIVAQHAGDINAGGATVHDADDHHDNKASGTAKGLTTGAIVGGLFGLAAAAIPGIGPFVTAGVLAEVLGTTAGAAAAGAIVGGTSGALAGALMDYGVSKEDAHFYEERVHAGGVVVTVESDGNMANDQAVRQILQTSGGRGSAYVA